MEDERLEQLQRHQLGQPALVQLQIGTDHDHRPSRVIHPLAEQVLPEAPLLALEHVAEGLQRAFVGAHDGPAAAAVIEQRVHRFLEHPLLVAHDQVGGPQVDQPLEAVVAVYHPPVEVVQVAGGEAPTFQRHQGAQFRGDHRDHVEDHREGVVVRFAERLDDLQPLDHLLAFGFRAHLAHIGVERCAEGLQVDRLEQFADRLGAHARAEVRKLVVQFPVPFFLQQLLHGQLGAARIQHHVGIEVQHSLQIPQGHVQQVADPAGHAFEEPHVRNRAGQLDVPQPLAPHLGLDHLHSAFLAGDAPVLHALVFAAIALIIVNGAEDLRAEQAVRFRLEGAVVDRLRSPHLSVGPRQNLVGRGDPDLHRVVVGGSGRLLKDRVQRFQMTLRG